jgi:tRNA nucleotidyltransferase (CCA-adding enzyme)
VAKEAAMSYEYLDHIADLGIRAIGATLEQAFGQGAQAMLAAISDVQRIETQLTCHVTCRAPDIAALFCEWLNELLYQSGIHGALFGSAQVTRLECAGADWVLEGVAYGEPLDLDRHTTYTEVKAATYAGLCYRQLGGQHILECVLDL